MKPVSKEKSKKNLKTSKTSNFSDKPLSQSIQQEISIFVKLKNQRIKVYCASGSQSLLWLFNTALHFYDSNYAFKTGQIYAYVDTDGCIQDQELNSKIIRKTFINNQEVTVLLKEEYDVLFEELKKNKKSGGTAQKSNSKGKSLPKKWIKFIFMLSKYDKRIQYLLT